MRVLLQEFRNALRALARAPGFALTATLMLGAGLGLSMYMFGAVDAFVLRPLPFRDAHRIAHFELADMAAGRDSIPVEIHDYLDIAPLQTTLENFSGYYEGTVNLSGDSRPERYDGGFLSERVLDAIDVKPLLGRGFEARDYVPGTAPVVLLGHGLWQNRFQGRPDVLGQPIRVNGRDGTVIGVMPAGFRFPVRQDVWVPLNLDVAKAPRREGASLEVIGRLREGGSFAQTREELAGLVARVIEQHPDSSMVGQAPVVKTLADEYVGRNTKSVLTAMMLAVLFVLLIACANVANLLVARTVDRTRELSIHSALGAESRRLMMRIVLEGAIVASVAGVIGFFIAQWGGVATMRVLNASDDGLPFWMHYAVDWRVVTFAFGVGFLATLAATLLPAWRASRIASSASMRDGGYGSTGTALGKLGRALVAGEIALCAILLVSAGLTVRSIDKMQHVDLGADTAGVLSARIALFEQAYPEDAQVLRFFEELEPRLRAIPGVQAATVSSSVPATFAAGTNYLEEGKAVETGKRLPFAYLVASAPSYFDTFRVKLLRGRMFDARDRADAPRVAIINQALADKLWPGQDPVGKRLRLNPDKPDDAPVEIVGLAPVVIQTQPDNKLRDVLYVPLAQHPVRFMSVAVRGAGDPYALADGLRAAAGAQDPDLPVYFVRTVDDWIAAGTVSDRLLAKLFALFAAFGLLMAAAGIYAVLAFAVSSRTREIGVRRALGAQNDGIVRMVLRQGMTQLAVGLGLGLVLALGFAQILSSVLYGVSTFDPLTFVMVGATLALVVVAASTLPTRRALAVDPSVALRSQ